MYGSGAPIGMEVIAVHHRLILLALPRALYACYVAAVGAVVRRAVVLPAATTVRLLAVTPTSVSVLPSVIQKNRK